MNDLPMGCKLEDLEPHDAEAEYERELDRNEWKRDVEKNDICRD